MNGKMEISVVALSGSGQEAVEKRVQLKNRWKKKKASLRVCKMYEIKLYKYFSEAELLWMLSVSG